MKGHTTWRILRQWALWWAMVALVAILVPGMAGADDLTVDNGSQTITGDVTYDNEYIGATGKGVLKQTGGSNTVNELLIVGQEPGSNGVYKLKGGSLTAFQAIVGQYGLGTFTQTAGTATVTRLTVGPLGEYNLQAGTLNAGGLRNYGNFNLAGGALLGGGTDSLPAPVEGAAALAMQPAYALVNDGIMQGYGLIGGSGGFANNAYFAVTGPRGLFLTNTGPNANNGTMDINSILTLAPERAAPARPAESLALAEESEAALTNNGSMNLTKMAVVNGPGTLANAATGTIAANGGTILSGFNNTGNLVVGDGGLNIAQGFTNTGTVELRSYAPAASLSGLAITNLGAITGHGQISSDVVNDTGGIIDPDGSTLTMLGKVANRARAEVRVRSGETLQLRQGLSEANCGDINVLSNGKLAITQPLVNNQPTALTNLGNITVLQDAQLQVSGPLLNDADTLQEYQGNITVDGGTLEVSDVLTNNSTLNVASTVKASKIVNTSRGKVEIGKAQPAPAAPAAAEATPAAASVMDATFINQGAVNIKGAAEFTKEVENRGEAALLAINSPSRFDGKVTNLGGKLEIEAVATFNKEVVNDKYVDPDTGTSVAGIMTVNAPATFVERVTNTGTLDIKQQATFEQPVENTGTMLAQNADVALQSMYDGGTGVNAFKNLIVAPAAYLKGQAGARFEVGGNLTSRSLQCLNWTTTVCELAFVPADKANPAPATHDFAVNGVDKGAIAAGCSYNFSWDKLIIEDLQSVNLVNGAGDGAKAALYVRLLEGLVFADGQVGDRLQTLAASDGSTDLITIANIIGNGINIYYDPAIDSELRGLTYGLTGGGELTPLLAPVPVPPSVLLLGSGLLGLGLLGWRRKNLV